MRPIDADALKEAIAIYIKIKEDCPLHIAEVYRFIDEAPTINTLSEDEDDEDRKKKLWLFNHGLY